MSFEEREEELRLTHQAHIQTKLAEETERVKQGQDELVVHRDRVGELELLLDLTRRNLEEMEGSLNEAKLELSESLREISRLKEQGRVERREMKLMLAREETQRGRLDDLRQAHDQSMSELTAERDELKRQFEAFRDRSAKQDKHKDSKIKVGRQLLDKLKEEAAHGQPEERRLLELAQFQARREEEVRAARIEVRTLTEQLEELRGQIRLDEEAKTGLREEVERLNRGQSREGVQIDYLKNIVVRYLQFEHQEAERAALLPVLATVLKFDPADLVAIEEAKTKNTAAPTSWLGW